jgi:hypothetical protein
LNFQFDDATNTLTASADSVIRIENEALGYCLSLVLASFVWNVERDEGRYLIYPRFEEIESHDSREFDERKEQRTKCYQGSLRHFLKSLYCGTTDAELFTIYTGSLKKLVSGSGHRVSPEELVHTEEEVPFATLRFPGYLRVEYGRRSGEPRRDVGMIGKTPMLLGWKDQPGSISIIALTGSSASIDANGTLLNPLSMEVAGVWAQYRIADLLPLY